jgi:hypothetical protein
MVWASLGPAAANDAASGAGRRVWLAQGGARTQEGWAFPMDPPGDRVRPLPGIGRPRVDRQGVAVDLAGKWVCPRLLAEAVAP